MPVCEYLDVSTVGVVQVGQVVPVPHVEQERRAVLQHIRARLDVWGKTQKLTFQQNA